VPRIVDGVLRRGGRVAFRQLRRRLTGLLQAREDLLGHGTVFLVHLYQYSGLMVRVGGALRRGYLVAPNHRDHYPG
jgi:hypothetical protein